MENHFFERPIQDTDTLLVSIVIRERFLFLSYFYSPNFLIQRVRLLRLFSSTELNRRKESKGGSRNCSRSGVNKRTRVPANHAAALDSIRSARYSAEIQRDLPILPGVRDYISRYLLRCVFVYNVRPTHNKQFWKFPTTCGFTEIRRIPALTIRTPPPPSARFIDADRCSYHCIIRRDTKRAAHSRPALSVVAGFSQNR